MLLCTLSWLSSIAVFVGLFERQYQLRGMLLCMSYQVLSALHFQQAADGPVLGKSQIVIYH